MKNSILITGASGNLGRAVVRKLRADSYHIIAVDATPPVEDLKKDEMVRTEQLDLMNENSVLEFAQRIDEDLVGAVLTVGGFAMADLKETSIDDLRSMVRLNFETAFNCVKSLVPIFEKRGSGQFVLIGARPALDPDAGKGMVAYALSKKLVFALSEIINAYGEGKQIHSTVIVPSTIDTPANRKSMPDADFSKWVTAEEIAETIAFLFSQPGSHLREGILKMYGDS